MTLIGVLTEKDVLRLFYDVEEEKNKTVEFFMTRPAVSYWENESLASVSILFGSIFAIRLFDLKGVQYFEKVS